jgi:large subunit ribosomal protein L25
LHPDNTVVCQVRTSRASMNIVEEDEEEATAEAAESGETSEAQASEEAQNPADGE